MYLLRSARHCRLLVLTLGLVLTTARCGVQRNGEATSATPLAPESATPDVIAPQGAAEEVLPSGGNVPLSAEPNASGIAPALRGSYLALSVGGLIAGVGPDGALHPSSDANTRLRLRLHQGRLAAEGGCLGTSNGLPDVARLVPCDSPNVVILRSATEAGKNYVTLFVQNGRTDSAGKFTINPPSYMTWSGCDRPAADNAACMVRITQMPLDQNANHRYPASFALLPMEERSDQPAAGAFLSLAATPNQCLTDSGIKLSIEPCQIGQAGQQWTLPFTARTPMIRSALNGCLATSQAGTGSVVRRDCGGVSSEEWRYTFGFIQVGLYNARGYADFAPASRLDVTSNVPQEPTLSSITGEGGIVQGALSAPWSWGNFAAAVDVR